MAYQFKSRSTTPGQQRLTDGACAHLFAEQQAKNTDPGVEHVEFGESYNFNGAAKVGELVVGGSGDYPAVTSVLDTDTTNGSPGTYHAPDAAEVISTAVFGPASGTAGTFDEAARNTDPGAANVLDSVVSYKIRGSTMAPIYHAPDPSEVWNTATFGAYGLTAGTKRASSITNCSAGNIKSGVAIDDVTGSYDCGGVADVPTITVTVSNTTATCVVSGTTGDTVTVYYFKDGDIVWTSGGSVTTSGTVTITGLTARTQYVFVAVSTRSGFYSLPSYPDLGTMQSAGSTNITITSYQNKVASTTGAVSITQEIDGTNTVEKITGLGSGRMMMLELTIPATAIAPIISVGTEFDPVPMETIYDR
jgi:hypothetical protein